MGSERSTRWGMHKRRWTVESCPKFSMKTLRGLYGKGIPEWVDTHGILTTHDWKIAYAIKIIGGGLALCLSYSFMRGRESYTKYPVIAISSTECHYGGQRFWMHCPFCSRRVVDLYMVSGEFACRHCQNLTHNSVQSAPKSDEPEGDGLKWLSKKMTKRHERQMLNEIREEILAQSVEREKRQQQELDDLALDIF